MRLPAARSASRWRTCQRGAPCGWWCRASLQLPCGCARGVIFNTSSFWAWALHVGEDCACMLPAALKMVRHTPCMHAALSSPAGAQPAADGCQHHAGQGAGAARFPAGRGQRGAPRRHHHSPGQRALQDAKGPGAQAGRAVSGCLGVRAMHGCGPASSSTCAPACFVLTVAQRILHQQPPPCHAGHSLCRIGCSLMPRLWPPACCTWASTRACWAPAAWATCWTS